MRRLLLSMAFLGCAIGSGSCETITIGTLFTKRRKPFCIPDSVKSPQAIQMFNKAATERSEMGTEPADLLWIMTLSSAFPCSKPR